MPAMHPVVVATSGGHMPFAHFSPASWLRVCKRVLVGFLSILVIAISLKSLRLEALLEGRDVVTFSNNKG
ncbi:hypothetical protein [Roseovarius sp. D22-M7]|uniref:hypothetical protein n=1 Tax=Roseovarius sp. D22-M7 TaxID=3127116 RepID=UPI00300FA9A0